MKGFTPESHDFSVLIPIFGDMKYLKNIEFLKQYGGKVILCTSTKESIQFYSDIHRIADRYNFRIFKSEVILASKKHKPNPWKLFTDTLAGSDKAILTDVARDEIIRDSIAGVNSKYCIFLDGDTVAKDRLEKLVGLFAKINYDIASVRVLPSRAKTIIEKLQYIEYEVAMDARKVYPWLTSGACMVAKTESIVDIMQHHSLFFSGGDIEVGKLARMLKKKVAHIPYVFYTDVPETFRAWFKQRRAWFGGGFRHAIINLNSYSWRHPYYFLYFTVIVYMMTPLRWIEAIKHPEVIPIVIAIYWVLLFVFRWKYRSIYYFLFPLYALFQIMIIVPCGIFKYTHMAVQSRNMGRIKLRPQTPSVIPATK